MTQINFIGYRLTGSPRNQGDRLTRFLDLHQSETIGPTLLLRMNLHPLPGPIRTPVAISFLPDAAVVRQTRLQRFFSEPFRPFFILGWIISLIGLLMWPLFLGGIMVAHPGRAHAFIMIQGFFGAFATGFLWTALPRMLEVPGAGPRWIAPALLLVAGNAVLHLTAYHAAAHFLFIGLLGLIGGFAATRFLARRDLPPPSFVLVISGLVLGAAATVLVALGEMGVPLGMAYGFGRLVLTEVFLLFLILGVSSFLAPRFLGQKSRQSLPDSREPTGPWKRQAGLAAAAGGVILIGALLQVLGAVRLGALTVALPVTAFILYQVQIWRGSPNSNWMGHGMRLALFFCIAAPWMRLAFPEARLASAHVLLLGGFGLITLVVGTRVVFGHSGYSHLFNARLRSVGWITGLYLLALVLRLTAEFLPGLWTPLLTLSALLLVAAHGVWGIIALPKIFSSQEDPKPKPLPPTGIPGFQPATQRG